MRFLAPACTVAILSLVVACGGVDRSGLFTDADDGSGAGGADSGGTDSGGTDSGGADSGGTDSGGTDSGGTGPGGTDSGGTDSGGTDSGGTDSGGTDSGGTGPGGTGPGGTGPGGTGPGGSGGSGPVVPEVSCGDQTCVGGSCCVERTYWGSFNVSCVDPGQECDGTALGSTADAACDGPEDCPGESQCCGTLTGSNNTRHYEELSCVDVCEESESTVTICGQHPGVCPDGTTCSPSTLLPEGYNVCVPVEP